LPTQFIFRYTTEKSMVVGQQIHAHLKQMEEDAYQIGAGEDRIEVDLDAIIDDTSRRSALLFAALTGSADFAPPLPKQVVVNRPRKRLGGVISD
jgi:hypothetical protein